MPGAFSKPWTSRGFTVPRLGGRVSVGRACHHRPWNSEASVVSDSGGQWGRTVGTDTFAHCAKRLEY